MSEPREQRLADAFVALTEPLLHNDFDVLGFLGLLAERAVDLFEVSEAAVVLSDRLGGLATAAARGESARTLEIVAAQAQDGPCRDCLRDGQPVSSAHLGTEGDRWPSFVAAARQAGFQAVSALPMRLHDHAYGVLMLLSDQSHGLDAVSTRLGQALADVATVSIVHQPPHDPEHQLTEQVYVALHQRIIVEQAAGVLAEYGSSSIAQARILLRDHARDHGWRMSELARAVTERIVDPRILLGGSGHTRAERDSA